MSAPVKLNFKIYQGATFIQQLRWESSTKVYAPITEISKSAPAVVTAQNHGAPLGWRAKVVGVGGMKEINSQDYYLITERTDSTVIFNQINSLGYTTYTSGGILEYNKPVSLLDLTARMQIRSKLGDSNVILTLTTENGGIILDDITKTITITITAEETSELKFTQAVYDLEFIESDGVVVRFAEGNITLRAEVTR